ncbi:MAG: 2TM domain-containing protein [Euryarchaeota archaeon]|nr:2TM domain-containing protein [Euryarchaeota archaeon]
MESECDATLMRIARKRAEEKVVFYLHLTVYVAANLLVIITWWLTGAGSLYFLSLWFLYVLVFWGAALFFHAMHVFLGVNLSDRLTEREFKKLTQGSDRMTAREFQESRQPKQGKQH